jgi:hypothetical protein
MRLVILVATLVGCINVALNVCMREAASPRPIFLQWFGSDRATIVLFAGAFLVGCASLAMMFYFYRLETNLARGLILMGTVSIVMGSVTTMIVTRKMVDLAELLLLGTLTLLFLFRWMKTFHGFREWLNI